ncbi:hypothetical protein HanXRQr2_Chr10g0450381 [Helianthus annuus]|uniref:Uncharacterized protein n=1 Tax=Helianthus annuus TaxID=4232 RepID=A0A9K3HYT4_HELAN|nr:hypothetical protein HanXRQr2_Chr10g0450381 [Helianthus annuus]
MLTDSSVNSLLEGACLFQVCPGSGKGSHHLHLVHSCLVPVQTDKVHPHSLALVQTDEVHLHSLALVQTDMDRLHCLAPVQTEMDRLHC